MEHQRKELLDIETILTFQNLPGIGNKTILKYGRELFNFKGITKEDMEKAREKAKVILSRSNDSGVGVFSYYDDIYPEILRNCVRTDGKLDPPLVLYYRGNLDVFRKPGIAIIGTREPTPNGKKAASYFASEFARNGFNIVSGLALGCDSEGHRGALEVNGGTTAFLANGLDWNSIYPKENLGLAKRIVEEGGLLLSEYPVGQGCEKYSLVARDRLQAGLSLGTVVVQTGIKGGTMYAVNSTLASCKPLFAVRYNLPEDLNHPKTQGNSALLSSGRAYPLTTMNINDIIQKLKR